MAKLPAIVKKNFKILIRSKSSGLIILLGPLLLILLVGTAFNTSSFYNIKVGTYSDNYNELSESIITQLQDDRYQVLKTGSENECKERVKTGAYHLCVIFPENLKVDSEANIDVFADQSRQNLVFAIRNAVLSKVSSKSDELSKDLTSVVVNQLETARASLATEKDILTDLKNTNENFVGKLDKADSSLKVLEESTADLTIINDLTNKTAELKEQTNDTKELTDLEDLANIIDLSFTNIRASQKDVRESIDGMKSASIDLGSDLADLERATNRIVRDIEAIQVRDVESLVSPIKTSTQTVSAEKSHINYLFPTLIMIVIMFVSLLLSSVTVIREKVSSAYFRNFISPTGGVTFVVANYITNILIIILQLAIVLGVMSTIQPELINIIVNVAIAILAITTPFILLGMIIGYLFTTEETSTVGAISLGVILLFFSNTIIPIETLSIAVQKIVNYNLFVISDNILRQLVLFEAPLENILPQLYILGAYSVVFIVLITIIYRFSTEIYNIKRHLRGK